MSLVVTPTLTITPTLTVTPTLTATATSTPEPTHTPAPTQDAYLPMLYRLYPEPDAPLVDQLICASPNLSIPDNSRTGIDSVISTSDPRLLLDLDIYLRIDHTWIGDLEVTLTHQESGRKVTLIDRPGYPASSSGCSNDNIYAIMDDEALQEAEGKCAWNPAVSGSFYPPEPLSIFHGSPISGTWTLNVSDRNSGDTGMLRQWCLDAAVSERMPEPTPTPEPVSLPAEARITNIYGQDQSMPLSCESRSAVDLARYFGKNIGEYTFFGKLPVSDNPEAGFVGSVYGTWGQIPPNPYGVHAAPVAALLRDYGLNASAHRNMTWDEVRAEVAAGRPVQVWVMGASNGGVSARPQYYFAQDGTHTVVSPYEHTVLVIGYTPTSATLLDGAKVYTRSLSEFFDSWGVLRYMGIKISVP